MLTRILRYAAVTFVCIQFPFFAACKSSEGDSGTTELAILALVATAGTVTCTGSPLTPVQAGIEPETGTGVSSQFLAAGQQRAYPLHVSSAGDVLVGIDLVEGVTFDTKLSFCGTDGATLLETADGEADGVGEVLAVSLNAPGRYYVVVSGHAADDTGRYDIDASASQVSGGGSCTNMDPTPGIVGFDFVDGECINFEADTNNPAGFCTTLGGSYGAVSCSELNVQGRCTSSFGSTPNTGGIFTVVGYTANFASDAALEASCNVDIDTALGTPQFLYTDR